MPEGVLVIGAANLDIKGRMYAEPISGSSNSAAIKSSVGGVARNIAENLARLSVPVTLITAVGDDIAGEDILNKADEIGINIGHALLIHNSTTGTYMAALNNQGDLYFGLDDLRVLRNITPDYLHRNREAFLDCDIVALDLNLADDALLTAIHMAREYGKRICVDPTSAELAHRLRPHLPLLDMITPNIAEAEAILGCAPITTADAALTAARALVSLGVGAAVITQSERGACYATAKESGQFPAVKVEIVDSTGAGDALSAAVIFGMLQGFDLDESLQLGLRAAALTLHSTETVVPDLSLDRLYGMDAVKDETDVYAGDYGNIDDSVNQYDEY